MEPRFSMEDCVNLSTTTSLSIAVAIHARYGGNRRVAAGSPVRFARVRRMRRYSRLRCVISARGGDWRSPGRAVAVLAQRARGVDAARVIAGDARATWARCASSVNRCAHGAGASRRKGGGRVTAERSRVGASRARVVMMGRARIAWKRVGGHVRPSDEDADRRRRGHREVRSPAMASDFGAGSFRAGAERVGDDAGRWSRSRVLCLYVGGVYFLVAGVVVCFVEFLFCLVFLCLSDMFLMVLRFLCIVVLYVLRHQWRSTTCWER